MNMRQIETQVRYRARVGACLSAFCAFVLLLSITWAAFAQSGGGQNPSTGPVTIQTATPAASGTVSLIETETIMVSDVAAIPAQIKRSRGKFFLDIINAAKHSSLNLVLESPSVAAAQLTGLGKAINLPSFASLKHVAGVFDAPVGEYHIKSQTTG